MDLYGILGVDKNASVDEIKKSYKKLALKLHPDRQPDDPKACEEEFKKVTQAYGILSDPERRRMYDATGSIDNNMPDMGNINDILKNVFGSGFSPFGSGGGFSFSFGGNQGGMDPFAAMFGASRGGEEKQSDVLEIDVSLSDIYHGNTKKIDYEILDHCHACKGQGCLNSDDIIKCLKCRGEGSVIQQLGPFMTRASCPSCGGQGSVIKPNKHCENCKGDKVTNYKRTIEIKLPKGVPNRHSFKVEGKGNLNRQTKQHNDITLVFVHKVYGNVRGVDDQGNIFIKYDIKLEELLCGFQRKLSLYDKNFTITSTGYFNPTKAIVIEGKGLPIFKKSKMGNIVIQCNIIYTDEVSRFNKYYDVFCKVFKKIADPEPTDEVLDLNLHSS